MTRLDADIPSRDHMGLEALALLSNKWHPVVLTVLSHDGPCGFNDLQTRLSGVSGKVLSEALSSLQDAGVIERREVSDAPLRVEYELTQAGRDLQPVFDELTEWGERYLEGTDPRIIVAETDHRLTAMYREWLTDRYTVSQVHDTDALETSLRKPVDIVLLDAQLPGMDASEFVSRLSPSCRTVVLVGDRPDFELLNTPCDDILRKPIVRETATKTIEQQLSKRNESSETRNQTALLARMACFESMYAEERLVANPVYRNCRDALANGSAITAENPP